MLKFCKIINVLARRGCRLKTFHYLYTQTTNLKDMQDVNRLKLVLVEQKKTSKWLSEALGG